MDLTFQLKVIDYYCTFEYLLGYRFDEYSDLVPSHYTPNTTVFCPFHPNTESKAAKVYPRDTKSNSEKLYCFAENKLYYPHSLLSPPKDKPNLTYFKSIIPYEPKWVFSAIWSHLPDTDKDYWKKVNPELIIQQQSYGYLYKKYRDGNMSLFDVLESLKKV